MGGGRKNLKRAVEEETLTLQQGQSIMQVVDLRGSNLIEVMDAKGERSLAIFPAKFQKSMWIKRGNFVVVDETGREEAAEFGRKVGCVVIRVLFYEQVQVLQKSPECGRRYYLIARDFCSYEYLPRGHLYQTSRRCSKSDKVRDQYLFIFYYRDQYL
nr:probable RNA-binding protein EIF1AD isoform X2 [Coffea arabica]